MHQQSTSTLKFKHFAIEVWGVNPDCLTDEETSLISVEKLDNFIIGIGMPTTFAELGIDENTYFEAIANFCNMSTGSLRKIPHKKIYEILKERVK